jgi:hypothetical protein
MAAQRLGAHAQVGGDLRDRAAALQRQPHTAADQLIGVLPRTCHDGRLPLPRTEILVRKSPSKPGRLRHLDSVAGAAVSVVAHCDSARTRLPGPVLVVRGRMVPTRTAPNDLTLTFQAALVDTASLPYSLFVVRVARRVGKRLSGLCQHSIIWDQRTSWVPKGMCVEVHLSLPR